MEAKTKGFLFFGSSTTTNIPSDIHENEKWSIANILYNISTFEREY